MVALWKRRPNDGWLPMVVALLWWWVGPRGIHASSRTDAAVNQHVLLEIHTTLYDGHKASPDAVWMLTLDILDDKDNQNEDDEKIKSTTHRFDKVLAFPDPPTVATRKTTVVTSHAVRQGQTVVCAVWQNQILLARQVVTPALGRTSVVRLHAAARSVTPQRPPHDLTTHAWRTLLGLVQLFFWMGLVVVASFGILVHVWFDKQDWEEVVPHENHNEALQFEQQDLEEEFQHSSDNSVQEEGSNDDPEEEEEEEDYSDDDRSGVSSFQEEWRLDNDNDDDGGEHPASDQAQEEQSRQVHVENLPTFRFPQAQEDSSSDNSSSLGPTLPPVVERHVVRLQDGKTTFEGEMERFSQLQLGSPQSFHATSPVFRRTWPSPPPTASAENARARGQPPLQPLLVDRTRLSPVPFPTLGEDESVPKPATPTTNQPSESQKLEKSGNEEYDPLDEEDEEEKKEEEHDVNNDELSDSVSTSNTVQHLQGDEKESCEKQVAPLESNFAMSTEQPPADNDQDAPMDEEASSINHYDRSLQKVNDDDDEEEESSSDEEDSRPSHNELDTRPLEVEVERQQISTLQESPPSQVDGDMHAEAEEEQQSIRALKQHSQPSPTRADALLDQEEEETQNVSTSMEGPPLLPAQKDATLAVHETMCQDTEERLGETAFATQPTDKEQQVERSGIIGTHEVDSENQDSSSIAGVVKLPSVAPPSNDSVPETANDEQSHMMATPKPSLTQNNDDEDATEPAKTETAARSELGASLEQDLAGARPRSDVPPENLNKEDTMEQRGYLGTTVESLQKPEEHGDTEAVAMEIARSDSKATLTSSDKEKEPFSLPSPPLTQKTPEDTTRKELSVARRSQVDGNPAFDEVRDTEEAGQGSTPFSYVSTLSPDSRASSVNLAHFRSSPAGDEQKFEKHIPKKVEGGSQSLDVSQRKRSLDINNCSDKPLDEVDNPSAASNDEGFDSQVHADGGPRAKSNDEGLDNRLDVEENPLAKSGGDGFDIPPDVEENPHTESDDEGFDIPPGVEETRLDAYVAETQPSSILPEVTLSHSLRTAANDIEAPMWEFSPEEALKPVPRKRRRRSKSKSSSRRNLPFGSPRMSIKTRGSVKRKLIDLTEFKTPPLQEYGTERKRRARGTSESDHRVAHPMAEAQDPTATNDAVRRSPFGKMTSSTSL